MICKLASKYNVKPSDIIFSYLLNVVKYDSVISRTSNEERMKANLNSANV